jgi:hypothetical protein
MPAPITTLDIVTRALFEIGAFGPGDVIPTDDSNFVLYKLISLLDAWNSDQLNIFATDYLQPTLVPNVQPLTIGEAVTVTAVSAAAGVATYVGANGYVQGQRVSTNGIGTIGGLNFNQLNVIVVSATASQFQTAIAAGTVALTPVLTGMAIYATPTNVFPNYPTVGARPVEIFNANIILNNLNPIVKCPLRIRDRDWWIANTIPNVPTSIPTDLYYNPTFPFGQIYLWPEQDITYGLEVQVPIDLLNQPTFTSQFYGPPGYQDFTIYGLAESICPTYGKELSPTAVKLLNKATLRVQQKNSFSPKMSTRDPGIPRGARGNTLFNWLSGTTTPPR